MRADHALRGGAIPRERAEISARGPAGLLTHGAAPPRRPNQRTEREERPRALEEHEPPAPVLQGDPGEQRRAGEVEKVVPSALPAHDAALICDVGAEDHEGAEE